METKFIEGTNEQYSIREDGQIISHNQYHLSKCKLLKLHNNKTCITLNGKKKTLNSNTLLIKYFDGYSCKTNECNNKIITVNNKYCTKCIKERKLKRSSNWKANNHNYMINASKKQQQKATIIINRSYIALILNISSKDLTNELYEHHKNLLLFKRQLVKQHNISIQSLN